MTEHSPNTKRERQLPVGEKVGQIIENVAKMALANNPSDIGTSLEISPQVVAAAIREWRERANYLSAELISDPAWIMILELLHAEIEERHVTVSNICTASGASGSIAYRWLTALEQNCLVARHAGRQDSANRFVELTPKASTALRRYFRAVAKGR